MKKVFIVLAAAAVLFALCGPVQAKSIKADPNYKASTNLSIGPWTTVQPGDPDYELSGYSISQEFQLNLLYQAGILDEDIDNLNHYWQVIPGWTYNFGDNEEYVLNISPTGGLTIYEYDGLTETVGGSDIKWTLTGWHQTILAGDIINNGDGTITLKVLPEGIYRPFIGDPPVNEVEVFDGNIDCEVLGYKFTGAIGDIGNGSVLNVQLAPDTINVPEDFDTIQEAIDAAFDGDTIIVAAGTYDGTMNISGRNNLTIQGVDKSTVIVKSSTTLSWAIPGYPQYDTRRTVTRIVGSSNIKLENLTMDCDLIKGNNRFGIFGWDSSVTVNNCIIQNMSAPDLSGYYAELGSYFRAVGFTDASRAVVNVTNCTFINAGRVGVVTHDYITATITGNTFYKTINDFGYAIEMGSQSEGVISGNLIYGYDTPAASDGSESAGIYVENCFTAGSPSVVKNVVISDNEIYDCQYAMWIGNGYNGYAGDVDIVLSLTNNNFHDNVEGGIILQDEDKAAGSSVTVTALNNIIADNSEVGIYIFTQGDGDVDVDLKLCQITGQDTGILIADYASGSSGSSYAVSASFCDLSGNGVGVDNLVAGLTVAGEKNWWGTAVEGDIAALVNGDVDYSPILLTNQIQMAFSANRLVSLQNNDGGWDWPLNDGNPNNASPLNTIGPIGKSLVESYKATRDPDILPALQKVGTLLLTKMYNFSPSDGYLAAALDEVLGGTTYLDHVNANFYGQLAAGTYNRNGAGILYSTASYVNLIRTNRANQGIGNIAAWDVGMGLVAAASAGVTGTDLAAWVDGVKGEINELDGDAYYDVIGLAGGVYSLAFVGEDLDPTAGEHAAASSLADLADILAGYQLQTGGFTWNMNYMGEGEGNESIQETAYAILALQEVGGYSQEVQKAVDYIKSAQLATGGWENYVGSGENNEVTAEGAWGLGPWNLLELNVNAASVFVQPGENVITDLDVKNLLQKVNSCQAMLGYSSTYLQASAGCVVAGGGVWNELIYNSWDVGSGIPGEIDTAIGIDADSVTTGTDADGTVAVITLTAQVEGVTEIVFRADVPGDETNQTMLSDMSSQAVWPSKLNSVTIVIDGTDPDVAVTYPNGGEILKGGSPCTITWTASDDNIDDGSVKLEYFNDSTWIEIASDEDNDGSYDWTVPSLDISTAKVRVSVSDLAGNTGSDESDAAFTIDSTNPVVGAISATQFSGPELTPSGSGNAVQGVVNIAVATSDNLSGVAGAPTVTVVDSASSPMAVTYAGESPANTFNYTVTVLSTTANGVATITVSGLADNAGNVAANANDTFDINKNQITGTVDMATSSPFAYSFNRDVVFKATDGSGAVLKMWTVTVNFTNNTITRIANGSYALTDVPGGTVNLSAKTAWTLRQRQAVSFSSDLQAVNNYSLLGGDLNNTNAINILDYSVLKVNWFTTNLVSDINGDSNTNILDFVILRTNFFKKGDLE